MTVVVASALTPAAGATISGDTSVTPPTFTWTGDALGPNDVPGQKDLTAHSTVLNSNFYVAWKWDEIGFSGKNTGDACALFDTGTDGNVDNALCVTIDGASATFKSTRAYTCGNGKNDRCTSTYAQISTIASKCQVDNAAAPQFSSGAGAFDTQATCRVALADFGSSTPPVLINTCSYPSQEPTSAPSDCVLIPGVRETGAIEITKTGDDATCTGTTLPAGCASEGMALLAGGHFAISQGGTAVSGAEDLTTLGTGKICFPGLPTGNTYVVSETTAPDGYQIDDTVLDDPLNPLTEGVQTSKSVSVSSAGTCSSGATQVGFTDSPVSTVEVIFTPPDTGVTQSQISCTRGTTALAAGGANAENGSADNATTPNRDDLHESYISLPAGTYTCTVDIAP
jgi:hypothetical protein